MVSVTQATRQDLSNEELYEDLQVLVGSSCDVNVAEPAGSVVSQVPSERFISVSAESLC